LGQFIVQENLVEINLSLTDPHDEATGVEEYRVTLIKIKKEDLPEGNINILIKDQEGRILERGVFSVTTL
jgi:hypothetical protein